MILALVMGIFGSSLCFNVQHDENDPLHLNIDCDV
jgi:hypothetical protein